MTLTSDPTKDLSVIRTENNESRLKEPSPTGGEEQSIGQAVPDEVVIRPLFGSYFFTFSHCNIESNCLLSNSG